jgi:hypothetical protein
MRDSRTPTFSSEELQKAVADARPILEGVDEARNRVSNDIKALEAYLQGLDLKSSFRYPLGKCFVSEDQHVAASLEYRHTASGGIEEEALVWGEHRSGSSRLLYEHSRWQGYVDIDVPGGPFFWDDATLEREAKPLIEAKFEIRKRMYQHLPDFVAALAKQFDIGAGQKVQSDDVPF